MLTIKGRRAHRHRRLLVEEAGFTLQRDPYNGSTRNIFTCTLELFCTCWCSVCQQNTRVLRLNDVLHVAYYPTYWVWPSLLFSFFDVLHVAYYPTYWVWPSLLLSFFGRRRPTDSLGAGAAAGVRVRTYLPVVDPAALGAWDMGFTGLELGSTPLWLARTCGKKHQEDRILR
eukprot:1117963-Pyramimonas_sp.AAC.1